MKNIIKVGIIVVLGTLLVFSLNIYSTEKGGASDYTLGKQLISSSRSSSISIPWISTAPTYPTAPTYSTAPTLQPPEDSICWVPCVKFSGTEVMEKANVDSVFKDAANRFNEGNKEFKNTNFELAASKYTEAITNTKKSLAFMWYNRGCALYYNGKKDEAILSFENALDIDPNYARASQNRYQILEELGRMGA